MKLASFAVLFSLLAVQLPFAGPTLQFNSSALHLSITANATLSSDIIAGNLTIASGVTLTTNGFNIYVANRLVAQGVTFITGNSLPGGSGCGGCGGVSGASAPMSYGGSGGAGGGWAESFGGGKGGSTLVSGGSAVIGGGNPGSLPTNFNPNTTNLEYWYENGMQNYLEGAGGGGGGEASSIDGPGGYGAFGIYIQAQQMILTNSTILANGQNGSVGWPGGGGGGGGGGCGRIMLSYQTLYLTGTYYAYGGKGARPGGGGGYDGGEGGGPCNVSTSRYHTEPIPITGPPGSPPNNQTNGSPPSQGSCYSLSLEVHSQTTLYLTGAWLSINLVSERAGQALLEIDGIQYQLYQNATQLLPQDNNYAYYITLSGNQALQICSAYLGQASTTTSTSTVTTTSSTGSTTIGPSGPPVPPSGKSNFWLLLLLLLLIAIGLLLERERQRRANL